MDANINSGSNVCRPIDVPAANDCVQNLSGQELEAIAKIHDVQADILSEIFNDMPKNEKTTLTANFLAKLLDHFHVVSSSDLVALKKIINGQAKKYNSSESVALKVMSVIQRKSNPGVDFLYKLLNYVAADEKINVDNIVQKSAEMFSNPTTFPPWLGRKLTEQISMGASPKLVYLTLCFGINASSPIDFSPLMGLSTEDLDCLCHFVSSNTDKPNADLWKHCVCYSTLSKQLKSFGIPSEFIKNMTSEQIEQSSKLTSFSFEFKEIALNEYYSFPSSTLSPMTCFNSFQTAKNFQELNVLLRTSHSLTKEFENYQPRKEISPENIHEHYIVRIKDWASSLYGPNQKKYGEMMHKGVTFAAGLLEKSAWDFDQLLAFLCYNRHLIALTQNQSSNKLVGLLRCGRSMYTPCKDNYAALGVRLNKKLDQWIEEKNPNIRAEKDKDSFAVAAEIKGESIELSHYVRGPDGHLTVQHTDDKNAAKIMKYVSALYEEAITETDIKKLKVKLGEIFWYICQAKPWCLGDPSIAESLIRTIWLHKTGENLPPWKEGIVPWESTVEEISVVKYSKEIFPNLFAIS